VLPILVREAGETALVPVAVDLANFVPPFVSGGESHNTRFYTILYYTTKLYCLQ